FSFYSFLFWFGFFSFGSCSKLRFTQMMPGDYNLLDYAKNSKGDDSGQQERKYPDQPQEVTDSLKEDESVKQTNGLIDSNKSNHNMNRYVQCQLPQKRQEEIDYCSKPERIRQKTTQQCTIVILTGSGLAEGRKKVIKVELPGQLEQLSSKHEKKMTAWMEMLTRESFEFFMSRCNILIAVGYYSKNGVRVINGCCSEIMSISELKEICKKLKSAPKLVCLNTRYSDNLKSVLKEDDLFCVFDFFFPLWKLAGVKHIICMEHVHHITMDVFMYNFLDSYLQDGNPKNAFNEARKKMKEEYPKISLNEARKKTKEEDPQIMFIVNEEKHSPDSNKKPKIYLTFDEEEDSDFCWEDGTDFTMKKKSNKETRFFSEIRSNCIDSRHLELVTLYTLLSVDFKHQNERKNQLELCCDQYQSQFNIDCDYYRKSNFDPNNRIFA
ncbi:hypothetical protein RFI_19606, partial [Reticulomyxa filosa]